MLYLKQHFNIEPARPAGLDRFIELAERAWVPTLRRAFLRQLRVGPAEYRRRFHPAARTEEVHR